jgi:4-aminobutyrate aminotransferase
MSAPKDQWYYVDRDDALIADVLKTRFSPVVPVRAQGINMWDVEGRELIDLTSSWSVANTGYGNKEIGEVISRQFSELSFTSLNACTNLPALDLAEKLLSLSPGDFPRKVWFGLSGSDANDCIARLAPVATGKPRFLTFIGGYHGDTSGAAALSGHPAQARYGGASYTSVPYAYCYRCAFGKKPEDCAFHCIDYIEDLIFKSVCPPERTAGMLVEAIQADSGDVVPPPGYLSALEALAHRYDMWFMVDEVKVGMGRTGKWWGFQHDGVTPDAFSIGKAIASGQPLSSVVARKEMLDLGTAALLFTLAGSPVSCAAGVATINIIERDKLMDNAANVGAHMLQRLKEMQARHPIMGDVRGKGLIMGIEFVKDPVTKEPAGKESIKVCSRALDKGVVIFGTGLLGNVVEITPPLIITNEQADEALSRLEEAIDDVEHGRVSDEAVARFSGW